MPDVPSTLPCFRETVDSPGSLHTAIPLPRLVYIHRHLHPAPGAPDLHGLFGMPEACKVDAHVDPHMVAAVAGELAAGVRTGVHCRSWIAGPGLERMRDVV